MSVVPIEVAHFWAKVKIGGTAMCWIWCGQTVSGYGRFREERAHRYAYQLHRGPIPEGMMIRHMCGNKLCVNPSHLEVGTMADNAADGLHLGERLFGEKNGRSKITALDARYIINNPEGLTGAALARKFGVSAATISLIRSGRRWLKEQTYPAPSTTEARS